MSYGHILTAVEMHEDGKQVLERARDIARESGARLSVVHVIEYLPVDPAGDALLTTPVDLSRERAAQAEARLKDWCRELSVPAEQARVVVGTVTGEILKAANDAGCDLIVVGHPPRKGLASFFSHTEEGVVHKANCDVLVIRLKA